MLRKILTTSVLVTLLTSMTLAQEAPGKGTPVASETIPVMNSAPAAPEVVLSVDDIVITPAVDTAVVIFSTNIPTFAVIDYGLTTEYEHSLMTEEQALHSETLGELLACKQYFYRISVGDTSNEGSFRTKGCPVAKKIVSKPQVIKKTATPTPTPEEMNNDQGIMNNEEELVLNAAPEEMNNEEENEMTNEQGIMNNEEELVLNAASEEMNNEQGIMNNEEELVLNAAPEAPDSPVLTGTDDTLSADQMAQVPSMTWLILFALLSGMIVLFAVKKKHKKWYQK